MISPCLRNEPIKDSRRIQLLTAVYFTLHPVQLKSIIGTGLHNSETRELGVNFGII